MRTRTIAKPKGTDAQTDYLQHHYRMQEELQFFNSTTVRVEQTTRGVRFHATIPPARGGGTVSDKNFQGVYTPGTYNAMDWVVIQTGGGEGAYISTADGNTNDPRTGINWIQFSSLNQWF